jgi:cell division protein FtsI/penicillin-binding protein 2
VFENRLNYFAAGMALVLLLLLGRFAYMQVVSHDYYADQAEQMRTGITLLEPQRASILLRDGTEVARTETVWDVYLNLEEFADPRTLALRAHLSPAHYDTDAVNEFIRQRLTAAREAPLPGPASRRRWFIYWQLRQDPVARADFELSVERLCLILGLPRAELDFKLELIAREVEQLRRPLGDLTAAPSRDVSVAWLRARPALTDPEYWERIRRFPKSIHFAPVLKARVDWLEREADYLQAILKTAGSDTELLRDLCFQAAAACRAKADGLELDLEPGEFSVSQSQDILLEEHAAWRRIARVCEQVVRGDRQAVARRLADLTGRGGLISAAAERLERLENDILRRFAADWQERWRHYEFDENPLLLMRDAPREVVELLRVNADVLPGVVCVRRPSRSYRYARELAHVLGNVGQPDAARLQTVLSQPSFGEGLEDFVETFFQGDRAAFTRRFEGVVAQRMVGLRGVERTYDERLSGLYGARASVRDARGRTRGIEYERSPTHPEPLTLTIDMALQKDLIETILRKEPELARAIPAHKQQRWQANRWSFRGCAVVLDVRTGAVLAMVSLPDFDPERLKGRSPADRAYARSLQLEEEVESSHGFPRWNQHARQLNRATQGGYAPGSTFKVLTALALLDSGAVSPHATFDEISPVTYHNGVRLGSTNHTVGPGVNMHLALQASSNGYFYRWAQELGATPSEAWETLRWYTEMCGIGNAPDGDFHYRRADLPHPDRVWAPNLAMLAIGQGAMTCAPIEIARLYALIANRGTLVTPHLTDEAPIWPKRLDVAPEVWEHIHRGMHAVVHGPRGTARHDVLRRINAAGKTGTAENGVGVPDHAWFAGFAPYDDPQVAFVILAAHSDLPGGAIAPVIGEVIENHFKRQALAD